MTKHLINELYEVDDADANKAFSKGEKREDYADPWKNTGNVVLVGLSGSGRASLASALAESIGMDVVTPGSAQEATASLKGEKTIIVLDDGLVENPEVQTLVHGAGKVFYLLADTNTLSKRLAERDGVEDREQLWRELSARLATMEPIFYSVLHFILHPQSPEAMLQDAMEKIAL